MFPTALVFRLCVGDGGLASVELGRSAREHRLAEFELLGEGALVLPTALVFRLCVGDGGLASVELGRSARELRLAELELLSEGAHVFPKALELRRCLAEPICGLRGPLLGLPRPRFEL